MKNKITVSSNLSECRIVPLESSVSSPKDSINHPLHYTIGKYECIDEMIAMFGIEDVKAFCRCNVYKYRYREKLKNGDEDLKKAEWYISKLIELESRND